MDYRQEVRNIILSAVNREIPIWQAQIMVEKVIVAHLEGEK